MLCLSDKLVCRCLAHETLVDLLGEVRRLFAFVLHVAAVLSYIVTATAVVSVGATELHHGDSFVNFAAFVL